MSQEVPGVQGLVKGSHFPEQNWPRPPVDAKMMSAPDHMEKVVSKPYQCDTHKRRLAQIEPCRRVSGK